MSMSPEEIQDVFQRSFAQSNLLDISEIWQEDSVFHLRTMVDNAKNTETVALHLVLDFKAETIHMILASDDRYGMQETATLPFSELPTETQAALRVMGFIMPIYCKMKQKDMAANRSSIERGFGAAPPPPSP